MMVRVGSISRSEIVRNNTREEQHYQEDKKIDKSEDCTFQKLLDTEITKLNKK
jgi:hypothetical protein